jgi:hypothetical protein
MVKVMDEKRTAWIEHVNNGVVDETRFDLTINRATIPEELIVESILSLLKAKGMINHSAIKELTLC